MAVIPTVLVIPMQIITNRRAPAPPLPRRTCSEFLQGLVSPTLTLILRFVPGHYISHRPPFLIAALPIIALALLCRSWACASALQRLDASSDVALAAEADHGEEEVMEFRKQAPYTGLDCARQMVTEEGWCTLLRAWWVTPFS
ncbi:hypothetical protein B0H19DRAFT_1380024 [Mycena capillaripes]|nr:hypothetical protein B0H19DRAFT_1380024 [Mycena capillaripes]